MTDFAQLVQTYANQRAQNDKGLLCFCFFVFFLSLLFCLFFSLSRFPFCWWTLGRRRTCHQSFTVVKHTDRQAHCSPPAMSHPPSQPSRVCLRAAGGGAHVAAWWTRGLAALWGDTTGRREAAAHVRRWFWATLTATSTLTCVPAASLSLHQLINAESVSPIIYFLCFIIIHFYHLANNLSEILTRILLK